MMNRQSPYILVLLFLTQIADAQTGSEDTWTSGFSVGSCFNALSSVKLNTFNDASVASFSGFNNQRTWTFHYQMGFSMGLLLKKSYNDRLSFQGELNVLWSRQKATLKDVPTLNAPLSIFQSITETQGTVVFNTVYLQIPIIIGLNVDNASSIEGGVFINMPLINKNGKDFKTKTLSSFDRTLNQFVTFTPPKVEQNTVPPTMNTNWGWLLGIRHVLTNRIALRLRYESGIVGISDFKDLRENRMFIGVILGANKK